MTPLEHANAVWRGDLSPAAITGAITAYTDELRAEQDTAIAILRSIGIYHKGGTLADYAKSARSIAQNLRQTIANPPADVQEHVLVKLGINERLADLTAERDAAQQMVAEMRDAITELLDGVSCSDYGETGIDNPTPTAHQPGNKCPICQARAALSASAPVAGKWVKREEMDAEIYETIPSEDHPTGTTWKDVAGWNAHACQENQAALAKLTAELEQARRERDEARRDAETSRNAIMEIDDRLQEVRRLAWNGASPERNECEMHTALTAIYKAINEEENPVDSDSLRSRLSTVEKERDEAMEQLKNRHKSLDSTLERAEKAETKLFAVEAECARLTEKNAKLRKTVGRLGAHIVEDAVEFYDRMIADNVDPAQLADLKEMLVKFAKLATSPAALAPSDAGKGEGSVYTQEELKKWWIAVCPKCKWRGLSRDCGGGGQIADTGDYDDPVCPECLKRDKWVPVDAEDEQQNGGKA